MINTFSKFYYGWEITVLNRNLDFRYSDDLADRLAVLRLGKYSSKTLMTEVKRAMKAAGNSSFSMSFDRVARKFTLSSVNAFRILSSSGATVASGGGWGALGFDGASDKIGSTSYTAENSTGNVYCPQFLLQSLTTPGFHRKLRDPIKAQTASGIVELSHFGKVRLVKFEMNYITNFPQRSGGPIKNNLTGVEEANAFMFWATENGLVEFMPDMANPAVSYDLVLESTNQDPSGTEFELTEDYDKNSPGWYRTGMLNWRIYE